MQPIPPVSEDQSSSHFDTERVQPDPPPDAETTLKTIDATERPSTPALAEGDQLPLDAEESTISRLASASNSTRIPPPSVHEPASDSSDNQNGNGDEKPVRDVPPLSLAAHPAIAGVQYPTMAFVRHWRHRYRPPCQTKLINNLLPIVGYLELTNALDFPANVWNTIPVERFAVGLMATGGSVAILSSLLAFQDFHLSLKNTRLLREERRQLLDERTKWKIAGDTRRTGNLQAWLDLNFREIGWEVAERMLLDSLNGFAGILVGAGTLLAIGGANRHVYRASNLLSGYIGNSFNVLYGAINSAWALFMFIRSKKYDSAIKDLVKGPSLRRRMLKHARRHQLYAAVNGVTVFVAAIGSMISATMWQGYVVLIPCVIGAIFSNIFWRKVLGYDRELATRRSNTSDIDMEERLVFAIDAMAVIKSKGSDTLLDGMNGKRVVEFMAQHEMLEDFCAQLLHDAGDKRTSWGFEEHGKHCVATYEALMKIDDKDMLSSARRCLNHIGYRRFRDQERMLSELWACRLSQELGRRPSVVDVRTPMEKDV